MFIVRQKTDGESA